MIQFPAKAKDLSVLQSVSIGSGGQPVSYSTGNNSLGIKRTGRKLDHSLEPILRLRKCRMLECHNSLSIFPTLTSNSKAICSDMCLHFYQPFIYARSCTPGSIVTRLQAGRLANHGCIGGRGISALTFPERLWLS